MSKSIKLKDNNYWDISGIVYNRNTLKDLIEGNDAKGFTKMCFGDDTGSYLDKYCNILTRSNMTTGNWHVQNNSKNYLLVNFANGNITGLDNGRIYKEYVLYNNTSGSNGNITLSSNASNYDYLEIFFRTNDNAYSSVKVFSPNGKVVTLSGGWSNGDSLYTYIKHKSVTISGTSISINDSRYTESRTGNNINTTTTKSNNIYITRVVGYK